MKLKSFFLKTTTFQLVKWLKSIKKTNITTVQVKRFSAFDYLK